ncbi:hypothetical protein CHARACLAT_024240 [Characodon lateralis]|uniref:Uncharacterized protein n=1 Tax=Characodon lateralis TaxID=208331 RepID=A0ABU7D9I5_9TELE|nr:hypothetical protein [Characodon lateralis]
MEREIDRRIGAAAAVMEALCRCVVVKRDLIPGTSHREQAQGMAQDTLDGLCLSAGLGALWVPHGGAGGGVWGEGGLGVSAESAAPVTRSQMKQTSTSTSTSALS